MSEIAEQSATAHAPGPWKATIGDIGGPSIVAADGRFIADVRTKFFRFMPGEGQRFKLDSAGADAEANARLIAAAPTLLKACDDVADWLQSFSMPPTSTIVEKQEHLAILLNAIKQATGKD